MTYAEIRAQAVSVTSRSDKTTLINSLINQGLAYIAKRHKFKELVGSFTLTISAEGTIALALPATTQKLIEARLINGTYSYPLCVAVKSTLVQFFPNIGSHPNGIPTHVYEEGGSLYLHPRPNSTSYTVAVTVQKKPVPLSADGDTPEITDVDLALVPWVASRLYRSVELFEQSDRWMQDFESQLLILIRNDKDKPAQIVQHMGFNTGLRNATEAFGDPFQRSNPR